MGQNFFISQKTPRKNQALLITTSIRSEFFLEGLIRNTILHEKVMTLFGRNYTVHLDVSVKCAPSYLCLCGARLCPGQDTVLIRRTAVERYRSQRKSAPGGGG